MGASAEHHADQTDSDRVIVTIDGLEELSAIREALDDIRENLSWWLNNHRREQWLPVQPITSMPVDTAAADSAERLNTFAAGDPPENSPPTQRTRRSASPADSIATDHIDDETQFCCDAPDLRWTGDPHFPGVACRNCGYIVADCGSVVMQPSPEADSDPEPREEQRGLFAEE